jgi:hypothetical protein
VNEIPGLGAVALDGDVRTATRLVAKGGDDASVVAALPWSVGVEIPERDRVETVQVVVEVDVVVSRELVQAVGRERVQRMVFIGVYSARPYTAALDATTTVASSRLAPSRTFSVPVALTLWLSRGSSTEAETLTSPA